MAVKCLQRQYRKHFNKKVDAAKFIQHKYKKYLYHKLIRDDFSKGGLENLSGTDLILNIVNVLNQKATKVSILTSVAMKTNAKIYAAMEKSLFFEIVLNEILNPIYDSVFKSQVHSHHELKHD